MLPKKRKTPFCKKVEDKNEISAGPQISGSSMPCISFKFIEAAKLILNSKSNKIYLLRSTYELALQSGLF